MMMQAATETAARSACAGRARYLSFGGTEAAAVNPAVRGRARGAGRARSLRSTVGPDPAAFMRRQRQPDGE